MRKTLSLTAAFAALALAAAGQAQAHARLTASEPSADASVTAPGQLVLHFNEKMVGKFSGFELTKADGAKVTVKASVGDDGKTLVGMPAKPLTAGVYKVTWHAVTADSHRMEGAYSFTVR